MILEIVNHEYQYEAEKLTRLFYPNEKIKVVFGSAESVDELRLRTSLTPEEVGAELFDKDGKCLFSEQSEYKNGDDRELLLMTLVFGILSRHTGYVPEWGMLTGIRPSKLFRSLGERAREEFLGTYLVSEKKTALTENVARAEEKIISLSKPESFSLYVSIPFCPSRCSYCSFVSHDMTAQTVKKLMPDYVKSLVKEISFTAETAKELGLNLESIYFGGGTPTTLDAEGLKTLTDAVSDSFDMGTVREYTVEAGRPDTVTAEKLRVLKNAGVSRISINPQSFSDRVLRAIGRKHTAAQTEEAFLLARKEGFGNINTDLIAGLPEDTEEGFRQTVEKTLSLNPENITVHSLALKRASYMGEDGVVQARKNRLCSRMLDFSYEKLTASGYTPYYMYRQSKTLGNLENTGYCKEGRECLYNIFMMEECHSVLAVGAGAVTRLKAPHGAQIDRIFNYKYPYEYIKDFDEILKRKKGIAEFYKNNP